MPKKISLYLSFLLVFSLFLPVSVFAQTPPAVTATLDPSNPLVRITEQSSKIRETAAVVPIKVELNHLAAVDVIVDVIVAGGTANVGQDYRLLTPRVVIPAGQVTTEFEIEIFEDFLDEEVETAEFEIAAADKAGIDYQKTHQIKILDSDGSWWNLDTIVEIVSGLLP